MSDFEARHIIEALRSGVPSRAVGAAFNEARPAMTKLLGERISQVAKTGKSDGLIFRGRYGEGKTHLLNAFFTYASSRNMVASFLPLGKETPMDKTYLLYQKIVENTYLPGAKEPGIGKLFEEMTLGDAVATEMLDYAWNNLLTDRLHYLLQSYLGSSDLEERDAFLADLEGDFVPAAKIRKAYRRVSGQTCKFSQNFSKTKHTVDYFHFLSHLFRQRGYDGWLLLFDEAEMIGKLGKKTRLASYLQIEDFLEPDEKLEATFSLFAFTESYPEDVIDKKKDRENAATVYAEAPESLEKALKAMEAIDSSPELSPITQEEIVAILKKVQQLHAQAYGWKPSIPEEELLRVTQGGGLVLRTKMRSAIEYLDQLYQYGDGGETKITPLEEEPEEEEEDDEEEEPEDEE